MLRHRPSDERSRSLVGKSAPDQRGSLLGRLVPRLVALITGRAHRGAGSESWQMGLGVPASGRVARLQLVAIIAAVGSVVIAFLHVNQSSQVASTGFDIRELDETRDRLEREAQRLADLSAQLRAFGRVEVEATTRLGMVPSITPDYVRAHRPPIGLDARLREVEAIARSQRPSIDDRMARWFHLSVITGALPAQTDPARTAAPSTARTLDRPAFPSLARAWEVLAGNRLRTNESGDTASHTTSR